jgi:hypothetical protein
MGIGCIIDEFTPQWINASIDLMLTKNLNDFHENLKKAKQQLHWDEEKKTLQIAYSTLKS